MGTHSTRLQDYLQQYFSRIDGFRWQEFVMGVSFMFILMGVKARLSMTQLYWCAGLVSALDWMRLAWSDTRFNVSVHALKPAPEIVTYRTARSCGSR